MEISEFITRNNLTFNRTQDEIVERARKNSFFGFNKEVLCVHLDANHVKEFVKKDADLDRFPADSTIEKVAQEFVDYMEFAWGKALDHRGISAQRSVEKLGEWCWLFGRDDLVAVFEDGDKYTPYGVPILTEVCEALGLPTYIFTPEDW